MDSLFFKKEKVELSLPEFQNKTIFYAVLNWGIGHATRSIPIINYYQSLENNIILFSDGEAKRVLEKSFPNLEIHDLPSYKIKYKSNRFLFLSIALQSLTRFWVLRKEKKEFQKFGQQYCPDIVISDNRYGCYIEGKKNFLMSHQLKLVSASFIERISQKFIEKLAKPFSELWVPDLEFVNLSGAMANVNVPIKKRWIGFESKDVKSIDEKVNVLILLSGPEPRRSELEKKYLRLIPKIKGQVVFIAGNFLEDYYNYEKENLRFHLSMRYENTLEYIKAAKVVICRSGYSTLIDLFRLKKEKIICIPTAGQPEQEYLAKYWSDNGWVKSIEENELDSIPKLFDNFNQ